MSETAYDIIVVGAGPGGYVAAIRAAQLGFKTAIVEREHLGGICLNWGCIPTKALLRSAELYEAMQGAAAFGIDVREAIPNLAAMVDRSRQVSARLTRGVEQLMRKNKVNLLWGQARLEGAGRLRVGPPTKPAVGPAGNGAASSTAHGTYTARHIILATGARPRILPGFEPDGQTILTYYEALVPREIPKSLLVMGSGAIGVEFASFYRSLGVEVTLVELLPEILPAEDPEIARIVRKAFARRGIRVVTGTWASDIRKTKSGLRVGLAASDGARETVAAEKIISAVGVVPNIEELGLETVGLKATGAGIPTTDGAGRTSAAGIYAIGDVAGAPMLAHKAEHEAVLCVEAIAGMNVHPLDRERIPACTYSLPQVASVGLSEAAARQAGHKVRVGRFPFAANGKAQALGDTEGLVKTVFDAETGALLGAHLVGPEVTELIHGYVSAMAHETTEEHLMQVVYPHPTLSETMHESVLDAIGRAIHI